MSNGTAQRPHAPRRAMRPEIESLRALAVLLVIAFHLWPERLTGGFVGVDVFFVISGFLITAHLVRELDDAGSISLPRFWARRIRRLFPAALLVLMVSLIAVVVLWPATRWLSNLAEFWASLGLVQNWYLAANAVDYFAAEGESPFQHYWSLSVEEQFYLVWPILIVIVAVLAARRRDGGLPRRELTALAAAVIMISLAYSIASALLVPGGTYFSTFSHAWEFAAGALLALLWPRLERGLAVTGASPARATLIGGAALLTGTAMIVVSAIVLTGTTAFPGWIALIPVTGTLLVIAVGPLLNQGVPGRLANLAPIVWIGGISYSAYLWHWPLIVFAPDVLDRQLTTPDRLVILVLTLGLAWATKRWVEDPVRFGRIARGSRRTYALAAVMAATAIVISLVPFGIASTEKQTAADAVASVVDDVVAGDSPCLGAPAMLDPAAACPNLHQLDDRIVTATPWLEQLEQGLRPSGDVWQTAWSECPSASSGALNPCTFTSGPDAPTIAIVGDSHAFQWAHAVLPIAQREGWNVVISWMAGCALHEPGRVWTGDDDINGSSACDPWRRSALADIASSDDYDLIITSSFSRKFASNGVPETQEEIADAFRSALDTMSSGGAPVLVMAASPLPGENVPRCLEQTAASPSPCSTPRGQALLPDPLAAGARTLGDTAVTLFDVTDALCDSDTCHSVVGGLPAYSDRHHLSRLFLLTLSASVEEPIAQLLTDAG